MYALSTRGPSTNKSIMRQEGVISGEVICIMYVSHPELRAGLRLLEICCTVMPVERKGLRHMGINPPTCPSIGNRGWKGIEDGMVAHACPGGTSSQGLYMRVSRHLAWRLALSPRLNRNLPTLRLLN